MQTSTATVRGHRIGGSESLQSEANVEFAPRVTTTYYCPNSHLFEIVLHAEAEAPSHWVCPTCSAHASLDPAGETFGPTVKATKTHMEQLRGRRTEAELEALLAEAIRNYRATGRSF